MIVTSITCYNQNWNDKYLTVRLPSRLSPRRQGNGRVIPGYLNRGVA